MPFVLIVVMVVLAISILRMMDSVVVIVWPFDVARGCVSH